MGNASNGRAHFTAPGTKTPGAANHLAQLALLAAIATFALLTVGESLWWNNAPKSSYPSFLVSVTPRDAKTLLDLRDACGDPVQVASATDGDALVRGGTWWPARTVWRVPRSYVTQALPG